MIAFKMVIFGEVVHKDDTTTLTGVKFNLFAPIPVKQEHYLDLKTGKWTLPGIDMGTAMLTATIVGMLDVGRQIGMTTSEQADLLVKIIHNLEDGFGDTAEAVPIDWPDGK